MKNSIKPIKKTSVVEQTIDRIYDLVINQNLQPGDRLPTERKLSEALNISRSSLREAIRVLDMMGIVEVEHGHGIKLSSLNLSQSMVTPFTFLIATNKKMLFELYEFRKVIEVESAKLAANKITETELEKIKNIYAQLKKHKNDRGKAIELEIQIHELIAKAGNPIMGEIVVAIQGAMRVSRESTVNPLGVSDETIFLLEKIIGALENHDSESAGRYMHRHINSVYARIKGK